MPELVADRRRGDHLDAEPAAQRIVVGEEPLDLAVKGGEVRKVHEANGAPADLVLIGRANATAGGADARERIRGLARRIEFLMQGQDQRGVLGDAQRGRRDLDPLPFEPADLFHQRARVEHDAVADDRQLSRPHHAGRKEREFVGRAVNDEGVAGIVAALKAHHDIGLLREPVDDLAFALVAPLGSDHDHIGHELSFRRVARNGR